MSRLPCPFGGRSVVEWFGATPDTAAPEWVRDRVFTRARQRCHLTGRKITPADKWQLEHIKPLSMGGQNRESNLAPALTEPHKVKSAREADARAKADRMRRKANGTWPKPVGNNRMRPRPFPPSRNFHHEERH